VTARFGAIAKPLADARGSEPSHDRKGVVPRESTSSHGQNTRAIVDEINADIRAYGTQYERRLYIVYDLGIIRDEAEFKHDLEDAPGVSVLVVKH